MSFNVELTPELQATYRLKNQEPIGVDWGIKALVQWSNGQSFEGPKPLRKNLAKLGRLSRQLAKKKKGSANRSKEKEKLAKLHWKISNIRKDALHKITTHLVTHYGVICMEDLNVEGMMQSHCLARAIADMGFCEFKRLLEYKSRLRDAKVLYVDRFFASMGFERLGARPGPTQAV